jgi:hypothetical protein
MVKDRIGAIAGNWVVVVLAALIELWCSSIDYTTVGGGETKSVSSGDVISNK